MNNYFNFFLLFSIFITSINGAEDNNGWIVVEKTLFHNRTNSSDSTIIHDDVEYNPSFNDNEEILQEIKKVSYNEEESSEESSIDNEIEHNDNEEIVSIPLNSLEEPTQHLSPTIRLGFYIIGLLSTVANSIIERLDKTLE